MQEQSERSNSKPAARQTLVIFYLLDTSYSMNRDGKIQAVNNAMRNLTTTLSDDITNKNKKRNEGLGKNADVLIKIAILEFSNGASWVVKPTELDSEIYQYQDLKAEGEATDLGDAFLELEAKLSSGEFFTDKLGYKKPAFILLSDGIATDDYKQGLKKLQQNGWFKQGSKIAIAFGDDADREMLREFTGGEAVLEANNSQDVIKYIKLATMVATQVGTKTHSTPEENQKETNQRLDDLTRDSEPDAEKDYDGAF